MFRDKVKIHFKAGRGGDGKVSFGPNYLFTGGTGGDGGNFILEGTNSHYDLSFVKSSFIYEAEKGERGGVNNLTGRDGKDLIFRVPLITNVYDEEGKLKVSITKPGQRVELLKGGVGGLGNFYYKKYGFKAKDQFQEGKPGEEFIGYIELELFSDIIFIGLPNAGKSSILKELTNADAKVGTYAFTTIDPQQGRMDGLTLLDLPGLIEDTYIGKGLGTKFAKHTRNSKIVAHFVSVESEDIVKDYKLIRSEVSKIENIAEKEEIIVITKSDLVSKDVLKEKVELLKPFNKQITTVSVYDYDSLQDLKKKFNSAIV